jgi:hypothetical protein
MHAIEPNRKSDLATAGFCIIENAIDPRQIDVLLESITQAIAGSDRAGTRQIHLLVPAVAKFLNGKSVREIIDVFLPNGFPVRSILFDKTSASNWSVAWHQDLTICVAEKAEIPGFGPWSRKDGLLHVQPPLPVLERMLTLRVHLDDCDQNNGALRVIPGSHLNGRLSRSEISRYTAEVQPVACELFRGGVLLMKPLLLHASSNARFPRHRRVLHIEFAADPLPHPLKWLQ